MRKPQIGDTVYGVLEHLYYERRRPAPFISKEYVVCKGRVEATYEWVGGRKQNAKVLFIGPERHRTTLCFPLFADFGKKVFYDRADAVALAERMTDDYERRWAWTGETCRRPWREEPQP